MASLSAHMRRPNDHERLAFHPGCPLCTDARLAGTLPSTALVGRRTQALLASGVLAAATTTPGAALAADPEPEIDGATAPEQIVANDAPGDSDFDPGGESTDLPIDAGPAPATIDELESNEDPEALDQQPVTLDQQPVTDNSAPEVTANLDPPPPPPTTASAPVPPEAASPAPTTAAASEPPSPEATTPVEPNPEPTTAPTPDTSSPPGPPKQRPERTRENLRSAPAVDARPLETVSAPPATVHVAQAQPEPSTSAATRSHAAQRGDRFHVVQRDESLWSIANDVLGNGASPARIAREVNRLWELNSARIGTGDRDLLMAGTRLALR